MLAIEFALDVSRLFACAISLSLMNSQEQTYAVNRKLDDLGDKVDSGFQGCVWLVLFDGLMTDILSASKRKIRRER